MPRLGHAIFYKVRARNLKAVSSREQQKKTYPEEKQQKISANFEKDLSAGVEAAVSKL